LHRWALTDLACVEEAAADASIPEGTTVPAVYTEREGLAWIDRQWSRADSGEGLSLAIADTSSDEAVGAAVLMLRPQPPSAGVGYWVVERARGRGFATRAITMLSRWALTEAGLARVEALVEPDNVASQRVLERAGFAWEGRLRSYLAFAGRRADAFMYSLLPDDLRR
jgi:RimJ/RimL family protein N-acetyltransferase